MLYKMKIMYRHVFQMFVNTVEIKLEKNFRFFFFFYGDIPRRASNGVYVSQLIRFARVCNDVTDFNARNKCLTAKLL